MGILSPKPIIPAWIVDGLARWTKRNLSRRPRMNRRAMHRTMREAYDAAKTDRLRNGWTTSTSSADVVIVNALGKLRARSRDLAINDDYSKRFFHLLRQNVIGPNGIRLQSKAVNASDGSPDTMARRMIEGEWRRWSESGNCTTCGRFGWVDVQGLHLESTARDGDFLIRRVRGWNNRWGYALQLLEADMLDHELNRTLPNGNVIRLGVERDTWGAGWHTGSLPATRPT